MSPEQPGVTSLSEEAAVPSAPLIHPLVAQAQETFRRDLPRLLKERPGQWVAYRAGQQVGFARTDLELYQECARRGLADDEYVVRCIEPEADVVLLGTLHIG